MFQYTAIALGGALGALLRSFVYQAFVTSRHAHPSGLVTNVLATLTVNLLGSLFIGIGWYCLVEKALLPHFWKQFAMTGLLGAFTTFSTFSLDAFRLIQNNQLLEAFSYILASVSLCLLATWVGYQSIRCLI